jgi:hypothetical protein
MVRLLTDMDDSEINQMVTGQTKKKSKKVVAPAPEPEEEDPEDDYSMPDDNELGESIWHRTTRDKTIFDQAVTKPPKGKKGKIISALSVDHPRDLPKRVSKNDITPVTLDDDDPLLEAEPEEDYDINEPQINSRMPKVKKRRFGFFRGSLKYITLAVHALFMFACIGFTYYLITIVRAGVNNLETMGTIMVILSLQVALVAVNNVLGTVAHK